MKLLQILCIPDLNNVHSSFLQLATLFPIFHIEWRCHTENYIQWVLIPCNLTNDGQLFLILITEIAFRVNLIFQYDFLVIFFFIFLKIFASAECLLWFTSTSSPTWNDFRIWWLPLLFNNFFYLFLPCSFRQIIIQSSVFFVFEHRLL